MKKPPRINPASSPATIHSALVRWYDAAKRDLPWRHTRDPYKIWISEVMLQQTTVATVIPYYKRWLKKFPTLKKLASAPLDDVLKSWEGLGYYARARNLHQASQIMARDHAGRVPDDPETLRSLPGMGPYLTAAVASIAFQKPLAVLDGNVIRVISRLDALRRKVDEAATIDLLRRRAGELLSAGSSDPGISNQAMMELGALICRPRDPQCGVCPVRKFCSAYQNGDPTAFPIKNARKKIPHYDVPVAVIWKGPKFFIQRRRPEGFLGGLWEFPGGKRKKGEGLETCLRREISEELGVSIEIQKKHPPVAHAYSMYTVTLHPFDCRLKNGRQPSLKSADAFKWIRPRQAAPLAFPAGTRRILANLNK